MAPSPLIVRSVCAAVLFICAAVVLGISAHVENSSRTFGISTSTFTFDAFVGAFTVVFEAAAAAFRFGRPSSRLASLGGEVAGLALLLVLWLASGIATTLFTEEGRSVCKHLDDLLDVPELADLDPDALALVKKILQAACSELHAELAFIWIGFLVITFGTGYLAVLGAKHQARGNKAIWGANLASYKEPSSNPFSDPEGDRAGRHVGVVDPNEEIERA